MSGHKVRAEITTRIDFHGVDGVSVFQGVSWKRAEDCGCPLAYLTVTAKASEEGVAVAATRLMLERIHAALGEFLAAAVPAALPDARCDEAPSVARRALAAAGAGSPTEDTPA